KARLIRRGIFEPRQEVEGFALAQVPTMVETTGHSREILEPNVNVTGLLLKNLPAFVLSQSPP
ncbi:hypothetical protein, partial [Klebsiella pneumoniae]|uniref:hypothetical protein n=1 Tax=Klebsiella pneumoniae TaxID=573 RepID=UPI001A933F31